jgi:hypothetical protein
VVVVRRNASGVQECEQPVAVFADPFTEPVCVGILINRLGQRPQPLVDQNDPRAVFFGCEVGSFSQSQAFADQPFELFAESFPTNKQTKL